MLKMVIQKRPGSMAMGLAASGLALAAILPTCSQTPTMSSDDQPAHVSSEKTAKLAENYGRLPLSFEANHGQVNRSVKFLARGSGYQLFLTGQEAVLTLNKPVATRTPRRMQIPSRVSRLSVNGASLESLRETVPVRGEPDTPPEVAANKTLTTDVIRMQLMGANASVVPSGLERLPGTSNYILGRDPSKWHTDIPNFKKVRYADVYPGIDLLYYGNHQQLEYDFVVAPGARTHAIRLHFAGTQGIKLDADGDLSITGAHGSVAFHRPEVYQTVDGVRKTISGRFSLRADNTVGFAVGRYDRTRPLVIDPTLTYSTYLGGTNAEFAVVAAVDSGGDAYVAGLTISTDFPVTSGAFQSINYAEATNAVSTAFVSKFNSSGTALLYSTFLGGNAIADTQHEQGDYVHGLVVDASGNAYVTGWTYSSDFPVTSGAFQTTDQVAAYELANGFVTKLNPGGTGLVYSTYLGGNSLTEPNSITIDSSGDAYVSGITFASNFPTTAGVVQTVNNSAAGEDGFNAFVTKLNPTGTSAIYSTYLGGGSSDGSSLGNYYWTNPIVVDKSGNVYVAGFTDSGNFPVTSGAYQTKNNGTFNITVSKLNPTATALLYSTYLGGDTISISEGLAVDSTGNAYVAGYTSDTDFPVTSGAFQTINKADTNTTTSADAVNNGFLTKINPTGTALVYSTYLGGTTGPWGGDHIYSLALDSSDDAYVAGGAMSSDFPVTSNAYQPTNHGATHCCDYTTYTSNGFLTEFNPAGSALIYSTYLGGSGTQNPGGAGGFGDEAYYVALGPNQNAYIVGYTSSSNFPVTAGAFETTYTSQQNTGFVADFDLGAAPTTGDSITALAASANSVSPGTALSFTATVTPASGSTVPTGSVVFSVDEVTVATVTLNASGKATYSTSSLAAGEHYILASYGGDSKLSTSGDGLNEFIVPIKPVITPAGGTYTSQQTVTVTDATGSAQLYYTVDGTTPTVFSTQYTAPLVVNTSKTLNVIAVSNRNADSVDVTAAYTIIGSPLVLAAPATAISTPKATLNAFVNDLGIAGTYYFEYGTSSTALSTETAKTVLPASTTRAAVSAQLTTLPSKTTYYYRVVITTAGGTTTGDIESFTTN
jgi:Bacterial Ig-like domain (group 3)/Chitobiase/beta-hexosaminidase C-terminal domain/Beta-propeller repeat